MVCFFEFIDNCLQMGLHSSSKYFFVDLIGNCFISIHVPKFVQYFGIPRRLPLRSHQSWQAENFVIESEGNSNFLLPRSLT